MFPGKCAKIPTFFSLNNLEKWKLKFKYLQVKFSARFVLAKLITKSCSSAKMLQRHWATAMSAML